MTQPTTPPLPPLHPILVAVHTMLKELAGVPEGPTARNVVFDTLGALARGVCITLHTTGLVFGPDALAGTFVTFLIELHAQLSKFESIQAAYEASQKTSPLQVAARAELADVFGGMADGVRILLENVVKILDETRVARNARKEDN